MTHLPTTCILAGGVGSRLGSRVADTPKPLIEVAGEPFLLHQLRLLAANGAKEVVLCVGYLGDRIEERVGKQQFGIRIEYSYDAPGLDGTLGAIRRALRLLPDRFLVLYGDTYLRLDYRGAAEAWRESGCPALMAIFRNDDRWDTSNVLYENGRVVAYDKAHPTARMKWIDYGLGGLEAQALSYAGDDARDLAELYGRLARFSQLFGYEVYDRFYEIGTHQALAETDAFLRGQAIKFDS